MASICGYTDHDLDTVFAPELEGLDQDKIRTWYNGYHWLGTGKLYNPHDILHLFDMREFRAHWFKSGQPGY
ncbi:MAG: AAA family ATPase [Gammaproteobacteria bacterium]|nr:AAA family ATPase [Gammaproteobacteria bacterium]MCY4218910.1 AAA family ATPase [Gammaproteobacteria bacterium]MCY4274434.1 AAA family ATPase [Gammaproteobacteria bacterium]